MNPRLLLEDVAPTSRSPVFVITCHESVLVVCYEASAWSSKNGLT
jgi:uncharacterized protein (DUF488 family)